MGNCLPSRPTDVRRRRNPSANVVSDSGELRQFSIPVTVTQVLQSFSKSPNSFFLCNSDRLYFDDYIPALAVEEELQSGQIYFLLPSSKLQYPLAATDMAALAVKASTALEQINGRRKSKARIAPALVVEEDPQSNHTVNYMKKKNGGAVGGLGKPPQAATVTRSGSVRRLTKYSSRRAKLAVRSFRVKLTTISEGSSSFRLN